MHFCQGVEKNSPVSTTPQSHGTIECMKTKKKSTQKTIRSEFLNTEFRSVALLGAITIAAGTIFYRYSEGWSWHDAMYFSISTLTTVGLGGIAPHTEIGKIFTSIFMLLGVGIMFGFISMVGQRAHRLRLNAERDAQANACERCGK